MERIIKARKKDGHMYVSIPKNCGYVKGQIIKLSDPLPNIDKDDYDQSVISSLPPKKRLMADEKYKYTEGSQVPDLPK